jgi:hypothetical protein
MRPRKNVGVICNYTSSILLSTVVPAIPVPRRTRLEGERDSCPIIVSVALGIAKDAVMFTVNWPSTD